MEGQVADAYHPLHCACPNHIGTAPVHPDDPHQGIAWIDSVEMPIKRTRLEHLACDRARLAYDPFNLVGYTQQARGIRRARQERNRRGCANSNDRYKFGC